MQPTVIVIISNIILQFRLHTVVVESVGIYSETNRYDKYCYNYKIFRRV